MQIRYTGRQLDITPALRAFTEKRLQKISRLLGDRLDVHVVVGAEKHRRTTEITLKFRSHALVAVEETADVEDSVGRALAKLEKQAVRLFEKRRSQKRRHRPSSSIRLNVLARSRVDHRARQVLTTEHIPIQPLTVEEAVVADDLKDRGVVVFRNPETGRVNVLYRRPDGDLSLIEPGQ
jgi:ribosome hibernation promoting factor